MGHIGLGYYNVWRQLFKDKGDIPSQLVMIFCILTCLIKMFFFMRIYNSLTYIVTMIMQVVNDLIPFFVYYLSFCFIGALVFDLIAGNPSPEYHKIGPFTANILFTMRISLGDFDFSILNQTSNEWQENLFWVTWFTYVILGLLIFLNFIIAEVSNSYETVRQDINTLVMKERAGLIAEAEAIMPQHSD